MSDAADGGAVKFLEILEHLDAPDARDDIDTASLLRRFPSLAAVTVHDVEITGPHGAVRGRVYRGPGEPRAGLVWVHGGAFIAGSLDMPESHWVGLEFAARGIAVLALDYRKALHGVQHPVLSDEVLAGWLAAGDLLGLPVDRLHLGGASAGANLSAGVVVRLRAATGPLPASLVLVYPVLHAEMPVATPAAAAAIAGLSDELRFSSGFMRAINLNYVGDPAKLADEVAFPANAEVTGLPATLILNAEADDLRASGDAFGVQLADAGVEVEIDIEPGTVHGYLDQPGLPAAIASIDRITAWLTSHTPA
jgi:acetyl esterase/lipase